MSRVTGLLLILAAATTQAAGQDPLGRTRPVTPRFGFTVDGARNESLTVLGDDGSVSRSLPLFDEAPRFGPGESVALLRDTADRREVRVLNALLQVTSSFTMPADREMTLGEAGILLAPRHDHARAAPFDIDLCSLNGDLVASHAIPGLTLGEVRSLAGGRWLAFAVNDTGDASVLYFDQDGRLRWRHDAGGGVMPTAAVSATGDAAIIGVDTDDSFVREFRLLDVAGAVVLRGRVPYFREAAFSPDGTSAVLAGDEGVTVLDAVNRVVLSVDEDTQDLAPGNPMGFDRQGGRAFLVSAVTGAKESLLRLFSRGEGWKEASPRALPDLAPGTPVLSVGELIDGRIRLVTPDGFVVVEP